MRRVLLVDTGCALGAGLGERLAALGPAIELERARDLHAAVGRLLSARYDLVVSGDPPGGPRTGLFLRHLCERRFPGLPVVLLPSAEAGASGSPLHDCLEQVKRLL